MKNLATIFSTVYAHPIGVSADTSSSFISSFASTSSYHKSHHQCSCLCQNPPSHHHNKTAAMITQAAFTLHHVHLCAFFSLKFHRCHHPPISAPFSPMIGVLNPPSFPFLPLPRFVKILDIWDNAAFGLHDILD